MELVGANCILRPWLPRDAESFVKHANNHNIWLNMMERYPYPCTLEMAEEWLDDPKHQEKPYSSFAISIDGEAVGGMGYTPLTDIHRTTVRAGYWLAEPYWNQGIMTEAFRMMCDYIFAELPEIHRIEAIVFEWNPSSCRVLEKCGFIQEARMKKAGIKDGTIIDIFLYARTR
ncbi:MAG TPA: GNAT family protein [Candidatus Hydrogenedentes bacterium]|nr:GNAT family protein [Candidatus Hydrogenedentota bacterium]